MSFARCEALLKEEIGLDTASIGKAAIERAVRERCTACRMPDLEAYWNLLCVSREERQELVESVVVPETWFLRDRDAFTALARFVREQWLPRRVHERALRVLSIPCSTGEEPYSIAMTLLDAGVPPACFTVDAIDVSARALAYAKAGLYRKNSFRGADLEFRDRHFEATPDGHRINAAVRACVQFRQGNLFESGESLYDIVFCRNLLIYFDQEVQDRAVHVLAGRLVSEGVLFVGPSETGLLLSHDFAPTNWPRAFAFHKWKRARSAKAPTQPAPPVARPVQRPAQADRPRKPAPRAARERPDPRAEAQAADPLQHIEQLANVGDIDAARRICAKFIRDHGGDARAFYLMGLLDDSAGDSTSAAGHYRRALYLDPHHHEALVHLAMLVDRNGDSANARLLFERADRATARKGRT